MLTRFVHLAIFPSPQESEDQGLITRVSARREKDRCWRDLKASGLSLSVAADRLSSSSLETSFSESPVVVISHQLRRQVGRLVCRLIDTLCSTRVLTRSVTLAMMVVTSRLRNLVALLTLLCSGIGSES